MLFCMWKWHHNGFNYRTNFNSLGSGLIMVTKMYLFRDFIKSIMVDVRDGNVKSYWSSIICYYKFKFQRHSCTLRVTQKFCCNNYILSKSFGSRLARVHDVDFVTKIPHTIQNNDQQELFIVDIRNIRFLLISAAGGKSQKTLGTFFVRVSLKSPQ